MQTTTDQLLAELDGLIQVWKAWQSQPNEPYVGLMQLRTRMLASIDRVADINSRYAQEADSVLKMDFQDEALLNSVWYLSEIVQALRADVADGYLTKLQERIHANLFSDYLEMAEHLLAEGYKDAAAVLAGGTLEEHLRQLCTKNNIPTEKSVETMNTKLRAANVYGLNEQKQVTAWYGVRTSAAHANYDEYSKERVELFIQWLRQFISLYPA